MLTLYDFEMAPSPRCARIFLAEKNLQYKKVAINLREFIAANQFSIAEENHPHLCAWRERMKQRPSAKA